MAGKPPVPPHLDRRGAALWRDVVANYELRADELRVLEDACHEADLIESMSTLLRDAPLMQSGRYKGMDAIHPLLAEIRQHRRLFALLAKQLGLPDESGAAGNQPRSVQA